MNTVVSRKVKRDDQSVEEYRNLVLAELKSITASGQYPPPTLVCGSGQIRNFFLDPDTELFVPDTDPAKMKEQIQYVYIKFYFRFEDSSAY